MSWGDLTVYPPTNERFILALNCHLSQAFTIHTDTHHATRQEVQLQIVSLPLYELIDGLLAANYFHYHYGFPSPPVRSCCDLILNFKGTAELAVLLGEQRISNVFYCAVGLTFFWYKVIQPQLEFYVTKEVDCCPLIFVCIYANVSLLKVLICEVIFHSHLMGIIIIFIILYYVRTVRNTMMTHDECDEGLTITKSTLN